MNRVRMRPVEDGLFEEVLVDSPPAAGAEAAVRDPVRVEDVEQLPASEDFAFGGELDDYVPDHRRWLLLCLTIALAGRVGFILSRLSGEGEEVSVREELEVMMKRVGVYRDAPLGDVLFRNPCRVPVFDLFAELVDLHDAPVSTLDVDEVSIRQSFDVID